MANPTGRDGSVTVTQRRARGVPNGRWTPPPALAPRPPTARPEPHIGRGPGWHDGVVPDIGTDTETDTDLDAAPPMPDEHEPVAHWVRQADLAKAMADGRLVRALCGYVFDPRIPWPKGLPV